MSKLFNLNYAIFTHHFESSKFLSDSLKNLIPPKLIVTLPVDLNERWLGKELFEIKKLVKKNKIFILEIKNLNDHRVKLSLKNCKIDLLVILGCSQIINDEIMDIPEFGAIGTHASLLPELRGSAPVNWALIKDFVRTGNTLMKLSNKLDAGEILDQMPIEITDSDNCKSLYLKVAVTNSKMVSKVLFYINDYKKLPLSKKQKVLNSLSKRRTPEDSKLNWEDNSREIFNFIRGLSYPYPNAFCNLKSSIIKINHANYIIYKHDFPVGFITDDYSDKKNSDYIYSIATKDGFLLISELEIDGKILKKSNLLRWLKKNKGKILT